MNQISDSPRPFKPPPPQKKSWIAQPEGLDPPGSPGFYAGIYDLEPESGELNDLGLFSARATANFLFSESRLPAVRLVRSYATAGPTSLDLFALRLQSAGRLTGRMGDQIIECGAGDLVFIDLRQTLDLSIAAGADGATDLTLWLPQTKVLGAIRQESALHGLVVSGGSPAGALIGGALNILAQQAAKISTEDMDALCDGLLALIGKALAPRLAQFDAGGAQPAASFVTIRRHIDQHLHQLSLNADDLTKRFGLSRASLYRLFEPVGGVALYIRKARLARAYQEIAASDDPGHRIGPVAYRMGFKNVSAFNRLFKAHYGVTPGEARESSRAASSALAPGAADEKATLAYWLRRIGAPQAASAATRREK